MNLFKNKIINLKVPKVNNAQRLKIKMKEMEYNVLKIIRSLKVFKNTRTLKKVLENSMSRFYLNLEFG